MLVFNDLIALVLPEAGIVSFCPNEVIVRTVLDNAAFFQYNNGIGSADGREAMRDYENGAILHEVLKGFLYFALRDSVNAGGGFVQNYKWRILQEDAGDGQALLFALTQADAFLSDIGVESPWKAFDEIPGAGLLEGMDQFCFTGLFAGEAEVVADTAFKKKGILRDMTHFIV